jgi:hypothetical protein
MPTYRQGGGFRRPGDFNLSWRGGPVRQALIDAGTEVMERKADVILARLQSELHKLSGEMAEKAFAEVEVQSGNRIRLRAGSRAEHTSLHELGNANYEGHPQIREIMDQEIPTLIPELRANLRSRTK